MFRNQSCSIVVGLLIGIGSLAATTVPARAAGWKVDAAKNDRREQHAPVSGLASGMDMGEGQIAVIAPGTNNNCPAGRIVLSADVGAAVTDDTVVDNIISWRDIGTDTLTRGNVRSAKTGAGNISYVSADQSLVAVDGWLLWQIPTAYKRQIPKPSASGVIAVKDKKPWWFDHTFRSGFGPGARTASVSFISK